MLCTSLYDYNISTWGQVVQIPLTDVVFQQDLRPSHRSTGVTALQSAELLKPGCRGVMGLTEAQGAQLETFHNACIRLRQMLGPHHGPDDPSIAELVATTGHSEVAGTCSP